MHERIVEVAVRYFSANGGPLGEVPPHAVRLLEEEGLLHHGRLKLRRSELIIRALKEGVRLDLGRLGRYLSWQEFEEVVGGIFREMGYTVVRRRRFRHLEIDLLAYRRRVTFVGEVKRWRYGGSRWNAVVREHLSKVEYLVRNRLVPVLETPTYVIPIVISLTSAIDSIIEGVPVVDVFRLAQFLREYGDHLDKLRVFTLA